MARDAEQPEFALLRPAVEQWDDDESTAEDDEPRGFADEVPTFRLL